MNNFVEILPKTEHKYSIIWLHGLGANGHDFEAIVPELNLPDSLGIHFIFPHAPVMPVTINGGMEMPAWFDIKGTDLSERGDLLGIEKSSDMVKSFIQKEMESGIPSDKIIPAGFSQGGVIALHTALNYEYPLAGVIALSTYLPFEESIKVTGTNKNTPFFMAHGNQDPVVPFDYGKQALKFIEQHDFNYEWHEYPMQHQVCMEEINDISQFIQKICHA